MGKDFVYARMSSEMSKHGGPEEYIKQIKNEVRLKTIKQVNKKWVACVTPVLILTVPFAIKGGISFIREQKQIRQDEIESRIAEQKLIDNYNEEK